MEGSEKCLGSDYILKIELVRFADGLDTGCKRKRGFKDDLTIDLSDWKEALPFIGIQKMTGRVGLDCGHGHGIIL